MRQYLAIVLTFFSLPLTTGNALATTLEDIEKFNKDQFMEYVRLLDNVETNQTNCDMLHGVEAKLLYKEVQIKKQLTSPEQRLILKKKWNYHERCENFWKSYYESKKK